MAGQDWQLRSRSVHGGTAERSAIGEKNGGLSPLPDVEKDSEDSGSISMLSLHRQLIIGLAIVFSRGSLCTVQEYPESPCMDGVLY